MNKRDIVAKLVADRNTQGQEFGEANAPSNIALCKYWGKRNTDINLPVTDSLSISLNQYGATTRLSLTDAERDIVYLNENPVSTGAFYERLVEFLDLFRKPGQFFEVATLSNIPVAAGLASSACGFAALTLALDKLFDWKLSGKDLSILARLGSGSACRSIWHGFVHWQQGADEQGFDSYAYQLDEKWADLRIGLHLIDQGPKKISSRKAMQQTVETSPFYARWPEVVANAIDETLRAIAEQNFEQLGKTAEANAIAMHATMLTAWPPISYCQAGTLAAMEKVWELRQQGIPVYFTQDAGPNLKLIYLAEHSEKISQQFQKIIEIQPFGS